MLKEAIEKIVSLAGPKTFMVDCETFIDDGEGHAIQVRPELDMIQTIGLNSLDALVKFVKTEAVGCLGYTVYITVPTHEMVECL